MKCKRRSFRVWVEEEQDAWFPDCMDCMDCASPIDGSPMMSLPVVRSANSEKEEGGGSQQMDGSEDVRESPINDVGPPQVDNPMHEENMHEENTFFVAANDEVDVGFPRKTVGVQSGSLVRNIRAHRKFSVGFKSRKAQAQSGKGVSPVDQTPKKRS
ncbi:hypothetical protein Hanom_Chr02g00105791 [Helianthus anomalus]